MFGVCSTQARQIRGEEEKNWGSESKNRIENRRYGLIKKLVNGTSCNRRREERRGLIDAHTREDHADLKPTSLMGGGKMGP
jgi:hypothetical protein